MGNETRHGDPKFVTNMIGQDDAKIPPSRIVSEAISVLLELELLDGEFHGKLSNSILGTQGQDILANLSPLVCLCRTSYS